MLIGNQSLIVSNQQQCVTQLFGLPFNSIYVALGRLITSNIMAYLPVEKATMRTEDKINKIKSVFITSENIMLFIFSSEIKDPPTAEKEE